MNYSADIKKLPRQFLPANFIVTDWNTLEPYFKDLLERPIDNNEELEKWLLDMSELEAVVSERRQAEPQVG
jgi:oligoendopeptidase F